MDKMHNPVRSLGFRLATIAVTGVCSFVIGLWGIKLGFGPHIGGVPAELLSAMLATLCALAASLAVMSFFAGVEESAAYVYKETQLDKLTGLHARTGWPVWAVRTGIEGSVLLAGWWMGGAVGVGTLAFALLIGPLVGLTLPWCETRLPPRPALA